MLRKVGLKKQEIFCVEFMNRRRGAIAKSTVVSSQNFILLKFSPEDMVEEDAGNISEIASSTYS